MTAVASPEHYRQNVFVPEGASAGPLPAPILRKAKLACGIARTVLAMASGAIIVTGAILKSESVGITGFAVLVLAYVVMFAEAIVSLSWLYRMWAWFPPSERHVKLWKKYISPNAAVGWMFVPYFSIFWMFVVYLGMADIFERMQSTYPTKIESPRKMAMITLIGSVIFFPAAPVLHYLFDKHVEGLASDMQARIGRPLG